MTLRYSSLLPASEGIFQAWAEATGDSRGRITAGEVATHSGTTYTLRWSPRGAGTDEAEGGALGDRP